MTASASGRAQFRSDEPTGASSTSVQNASPVVPSETDVAETFRRLRGKLRADGNGAVVEADLSYSDITDEALVPIGIFQQIKELSALKQQRAAIHAVSSGPSLSKDAPIEVIPATFSNVKPR